MLQSSSVETSAKLFSELKLVTDNILSIIHTQLWSGHVFALNTDFTVVACPSSVQLARRVLQLERVNCSLRKDLETEGNKTARLQEEVTNHVVSL